MRFAVACASHVTNTGSGIGGIVRTSLGHVMRVSNHQICNCSYKFKHGLSNHYFGVFGVIFLMISKNLGLSIFFKLKRFWGS